ncbi:MAG TPA: GGDEF domain-containing protein [Methylomirabilota bacterium]|nr:GGDEF domain-containing protein [Methylomirabilota bacterium]
MSEQARHRVLRTLVWLAVLPLPIVAYMLGVYVVTRGEGGSHAQHLLSSQAVLVFAALLVSGVGGFLIWSTATSVARTTSVQTRLDHLDDALADRLEQQTPLMNSFTRMLATIERQTDEINSFSQRLDNAYRDLESAHARLQEVTFTDEVTRLYNRRFFSIRLEEEIGRYRRFGHPMSLVLLDLDGFKGVNDGLGHLAGDETLRGVAEVLLKNTRAIDVISRYGGDEFAVLLVETSRAGAEPYAERIREILAAHSFSHGQQVTASLGIAALPEDVADADDLIRAADEALYAAKRAGKNGVAAYAALDATAESGREVPVA